MWANIGAFVVALLIIFCTRWINKWRNPKCENGVLPPGSMGLPFIGETIQFFTPSYSVDVHKFIKTRIARFGPIFRTSLAGRPVAVIADPEVINYIFHEGEMVEVNYISVFGKIFELEGKVKEDRVGPVEKYVRTSMPVFQLGYKQMKERWLPEMETLVNKTLRDWSTQSSVEVKHASAVMISDFVAKQLFSYDADSPSRSKISEKLTSILEDLPFIPLNVHGTTYNKWLKKMKEALSILREVIKERRSGPSDMKRGDFLDQVVAQINSEAFLTEDFYLVVFFGILFAGLLTNSVTITLALKFITENPLVLQELTAEHEAIVKRKENPNSPLTLDQYKSMTFTNQVLNETMRLANDTPGLLRRVLKDIHVKGYTIPAGWTLMLVMSPMHLDPTTYKDPLTFNPWRWKELDPKVVSNKFLPFGSGFKVCPGAEFTRAFFATFFHVLLTKYRFKKTKEGKLARHPHLGFGDGLHIHFMDKHC